MVAASDTSAHASSPCSTITMTSTENDRDDMTPKKKNGLVPSCTADTVFDATTRHEGGSNGKVFPRGGADEPSGTVKWFSFAHETSVRALTMPKAKRGTYIARLILCLEECLKSLGVSTSTHSSKLLMELEKIACFIHESMSIGSRNYHSVQHVFDVAQGLNDDDPISVIAALFHDCVYYHVDGGLSYMQYNKLRGVVEEQASNGANRSNHHMPLYKAKTSNPPSNDDDEVLAIVEMVFGYSKGQEVTHQNGLNEFLSTMICVRELQPFLSKPILAQLACCIEATIPFRSPNKDNGKTCTEALYDRMVQVNDCFQLGLTQADLVRAVQRAVDLSNSDVANFGTHDVLWFLDNTWSLLPESNEGLRQQYLSSVQQFQFAVYKMYGFFKHFLKPEHIFVEFQGKPERAQLQERVARAKRNVELGCKYVGAKLLSLSVLAAFAELTGGDAPISLFMGDLPSRSCSSNRRTSSPQQHLDSSDHSVSCTVLAGQGGNDGKRNSKILSFSERIVEESNFIYPDNEAATNIDLDVYEVLSKGRRAETSFDVKQSPMAAYLYSILGDEEFSNILQEITLYPMTSEIAWALLRRLPRSAVVEISKNIQPVAISRSDTISEVVAQL